MKEIWKDIPGYEGLYQVSNMGRVRSLDRTIIYKNGQIHFYKGKMLSPGKGPTGYLSVRLGDKGREAGVHRLVAEAFIPNPDGKTDVNHTNGIKNDNRASNLEWCTRAENMKHCKEVLEKQVGKAPIKIRCVETGEIFSSLSDAAKKYALNTPHLSEVIAQKSSRKMTGGFHWEKAS